MLCLHLLSVIVAILYLMFDQSKAVAPLMFSEFLRPCPNLKNTVFTTDGNNCYSFRNTCYMRRKNYERCLANKPILSLTNKTKCEFQCARNCDVGEGVVCGKYESGWSMYFANHCELLKTACLDGQSIVKVPHELCSRLG